MTYDLLTPARPQRSEEAVDPGLRAFLGQTYWKLAGGLALSALAAWGVADWEPLRTLFFATDTSGGIVGVTGWGLVLLFSPLVVLFIASFVTRAESRRGSAALYWTIALLVGASLGLLVLSYTGAALVSTFLITACAFAGLSLWGGMTKRNLSGLGNFLVAALLGLILATIVSLFVRSSALYFTINVVGVLIFAGLIATDTQRLKAIYYQSADSDTLGTNSNYGALTLYLNFINLFELLLSLSGSRSRR